MAASMVKPHVSDHTSPHARRAREARLAAALALGIDDGYVDAMVERFYAQVQRDELLGPVFASHIGSWPDHLAHMKRFWRSVLFSSGEFRGNPMLKHLMIAGLTEEMFERWLALFREILEDIGRKDAAELVHSRARKIANSLLAAIEAQSRPKAV